MDPHRFNPGRDPTFPFDAYPNPTFHNDADTDPAPHQGNAKLRPTSYRGQTIHSSTPPLRMPHGPQWLYVEPSKLLKFKFDPDSVADTEYLSRIRIFSSRISDPGSKRFWIPEPDPHKRI